MRFFILLILLVSFRAVFAQLPATLNPELQPQPLDYAEEKSWSCLPFREDAGDVKPKKELVVSDSVKQVDVFYIYPTLYMKGKTWLADPQNVKLNRRIDKYPIRLQAGVFNASGRVYAPRYRQAIINSFYDTTGVGVKALDMAYQDVKRAFDYYMSNYNHGRPVIIAGHSQGSYHIRRLIAEYFDGKPLQSKLVCAYIVGMGINANTYQVLEPCGDASQTGCYVTWASFKKGYDPGKSILYGNICVNPISWKLDTTAIPASSSKGSVLLDISRKRLNCSDAQIHDNYLWVKSKLPFVGGSKVLHIVDYNLFWYDIRANVAERVKSYMQRHASR